jgi:hypothetical protein
MWAVSTDSKAEQDRENRARSCCMVPVVADDHGIFKEPLKHRSWELY